MADSQNKAILVFTAVTIIFLPLSFFTSYWSMNLNGMSENRRTEAYFWKVCGSISFLVIFLISLYAFRRKLRARLLKREPHLRMA